MARSNVRVQPGVSMFPGDVQRSIAEYGVWLHTGVWRAVHVPSVCSATSVSHRGQRLLYSAVTPAGLVKSNSHLQVACSGAQSYDERVPHWKDVGMHA